MPQRLEPLGPEHDAHRPMILDPDPVGRYQARSLMQEADVACRQRRRYRHTTDSGHGLPVAPNLLKRQFTVAEPNQAWLADITAIWTLEGWLYLAAVLDLYDRQVIGWAMADPHEDVTNPGCPGDGNWPRRPPRGVLHHSDSNTTSYQVFLG